jgi:two-component sensor histidine kinase
MALVHNKLYESRNLADLNVDEYVVGLVDYLLGSYVTDGSRIAVKTDIANLSFGVDTAIPLGFIITELVSNCLKHAFPEGRDGQVSISLRSLGEEEFELIVEDDGVGIPVDVNFRNPDTLGLDLVNTFADQLDGTIALGGEHGAEVRVRFREVKRR